MGMIKECFYDVTFCRNYFLVYEKGKKNIFYFVLDFLKIANSFTKFLIHIYDFNYFS